MSRYFMFHTIFTMDVLAMISFIYMETLQNAGWVRVTYEWLSINFHRLLMEEVQPPTAAGIRMTILLTASIFVRFLAMEI